MDFTTKFSDWFVAQFGKRPYDSESEATLVEMVCDGLEAQNKLNGCRMWDEQREAALTAWLAKENIANK